MKRATRTLTSGIIAVLILLGLARMFFFGIYYVDSPSMEPTLHGALEGGDHALVVYGDASGLERFDLVVIQHEGKREPLVKRVVALPGESVAVRGGDLWIDEALLEPDQPHPQPVLIFDDELLELESAFRVGEPWSRVEEGWLLDASAVPAGSDAGLMFMRLPLNDHYFGPDETLVLGKEGVGDGILEFEVRVEDPGTKVRLGLLEQGDKFEVTLATDASGSASATLERRTPQERSELAHTEVAFGVGFHELRFSNVDDHLTFEIDRETIFSVKYEGNHLHPSDNSRSGLSLPTDRVYLGGEGGRLTLGNLRVYRDLHYTPRGKYASTESVQLGPGEIFVLGDNSRQSQDGRDWGPTDVGEVIGRPVGVVWPPSRMGRFPDPQGDSSAKKVDEGP